MTHKKEFPRDMSFVDRQGNIVHPSKEDYHLRKSANVGKAYGFFDCDASKQEIEAAMPRIRRDYAHTPSELELSLHEGTSELEFDETLTKALAYPDDYRIMTKERKKQGYTPERVSLSSLKYVLAANYPGQSNEKVAGELGDILNYVRNLNQDETMFRAAIVYEKNGEYCLRE